MDYFKILPEEISLDILIRLPAETVLECKLVCPNCKNLISHHPSFSKLHMQHHLNHPSSDNSGKLSFLFMGYEDPRFIFKQLYYFEYTNENNISRIRRINLTFPFASYGIVGSFNGLACIYGRQDHEIYGPACICNPITRECVILPKCKNPKNLRWNHLFDGFGYLPSTDEYKVVRIYALLGETNSIEVEIYTLGSGNGWRNLGKFDYNLEISHGVHGAFANGALYWTDMEERVVAFDLAEEKCRGYLLSPSFPHLNSVVSSLGVWEGFLMYNANHVKDISFEYEIWMLKSENDNHHMEEQEEHQSPGWSKAHTSVRSEPFAFTKSGCVLRYTNSCFYIDDPKSLTSTMLADCGKRIFQVHCHQNSLIRLKELGEEDAKILESGEIEEARSSDWSTYLDSEEENF